MTDIVVVDEQTLVINDTLTTTILETASPTVVTEAVESASIVEVPHTTEVLTQADVTDIVEVGEQVLIETAGQQGPPGAPGTGTALVYTTAEAISGHTVVTLNATGCALPADPANAAHANAVVGITTGAADAGAQTTVITSGLLIHNGWTFTPDAPVFVGTSGVITQTPPVGVWQKAIGVALSPTSIVVEFQPAIF